MLSRALIAALKIEVGALYKEFPIALGALAIAPGVFNAPVAAPVAALLTRDPKDLNK
jgi:hypothetical protein